MHLVEPLFGLHRSLSRSQFRPYMELKTLFGRFMDPARRPRHVECLRPELLLEIYLADIATVVKRSNLKQPACACYDSRLRVADCENCSARSV